MERGSDKHGPVKDDELEREIAEAVRGNPPVRAEQWPDPEGTAVEQPESSRTPEGAATPLDLQ